MKKFIIVLSFLTLPIFSPNTAKADLWGADLPLLAEIVFNTLHTMMQLKEQTEMFKDEMAGINDRINRIKTIADVVQPSSWDKWKDPVEALRRLKLIYHTLPKEYRNDKADAIEDELSKAMNLIAKVSSETNTTFYSGKELERKGADASPGVAQKLTASGVGTLIAQESQTQVIQSHILSLLTQMLAEGNEKESRLVVSKGTEFNSYSQNLGNPKGWFSTFIIPLRMAP